MSQRIISPKTVIILISFFLSITANTQELNILVEEALSNNPEIQKFELQYKRASEKVNEVDTYPNTDFGVGYFISEPETRTGPQKFKISIKQMIPWFGTITSRENYVNSLADAKFEDIVITKRKLITSVSQSYYKLYANKAKQNILTQNIKLLSTYETMALTSVENGKASAVDVLRLQMRQNELQQLKEILQEQFKGEESKINNLLNRNSDVSVRIIDNLRIPLNDFNSNSSNLILHPELVKYDKLFLSVQKSELLNQKESSPIVGFGLDYVNVAETSNQSIIDNGKDIIMPMLSISIPIFNKKYKSKTKQNFIKQKEIEANKNQRFNNLKTAYNLALTNRQASRISYKIQTKNLKQAKDAEKILVKNYETGTINFIDVLDIQELQLKFQMNQIESVKIYYVQSTIINYLIK